MEECRRRGRRRGKRGKGGWMAARKNELLKRSEKLEKGQWRTWVMASRWFSRGRGKKSFAAGKVKICSRHAFPYDTRKCVKSARALSITSSPESPWRIADSARADRERQGREGEGNGKKNSRVLFRADWPFGPGVAALFSYYPKLFSVSMARNSSKQRAVKWPHDYPDSGSGSFINSRGSLLLLPRCVLLHSRVCTIEHLTFPAFAYCRVKFHRVFSQAVYSITRMCVCARARARVVCVTITQPLSNPPHCAVCMHVKGLLRGEQCTFEAAPTIRRKRFPIVT